MIWAFPDLDRTGHADDFTWRHAFADIKWSSLFNLFRFYDNYFTLLFAYVINVAAVIEEDDYE